MRKKIIKYLLAIFVLFSIGGGASILALTRVTTNLQNLINLHRVEIIRQDLLINIKTVQNNLFTIGTTFGPELDVIVQNVLSLDSAVRRCSSCHHSPELTAKLKNMQNLVDKYKDALSAFITTTADPERVERLKEVAVDIGDYLMFNAREMTFIAHQRLQSRTERALDQVQYIRHILLLSLFGTMMIGFFVALRLTREIVNPVQVLSKAAKEVAEGKLGYTVDLSDGTEFGMLARTFNEMSMSLRQWHDRTLKYMAKLKGLHRVTLSLHMVTSPEDIINEFVYGVSDFVDAEYILLFLYENEQKRYIQKAQNINEDFANIEYDETFVYEIYKRCNQRACRLLPSDENFQRLFPDRTDLKDAFILWIRQKDKLKGFLLILNRRDNFSEDDVRLISIIANNFAVAMDNARLYKDLQEQMRRLREAQEQLVQAAKLAAIGELAANIAHEINNPLTTILGYAELMKEEEDMEGIKNDLNVIESESLRARDIVQQLLEFSRKRPLNLEYVDINQVLDEVLKFVTPNIKGTGIRLRKEYGELPPIKADANQIKQVFLNLINNAIHAMPEGGTLDITTSTKDGFVCIEISDTGVGIPDDILPRIFEPFFTTKKEKGTGLGLPISYRIIEGHGGKIEVRSKVQEGTTFRVYLPFKGPSLQRSP